MPEDSSQNTPYDPKGKRVSDVQEYMEENPDQVDDIKAAEANGDNRPGIMNYEVDSDDPEKENIEDTKETPSDEPEVLSPEKTNADGKTVAGPMTEQDPEEAKEDAVEKSAAAAEGDVPEGYSPYTDPMVPSSSLAEIINAELASGNGSPTLKALHDNKPDEDAPKKDDKSTS